jgi:hypothetical protein
MTKQRITKTGLDYFPIDVDWLSDPKLRQLQARFGTRGVGILVRLLCDLYRNGYCLAWDKASVEGFCWDAREDVETVSGVVELLLSSGFFDRSLAESGTPVLTSAGIQRRYLNVTSRRVNRSIPIHLDLNVGRPHSKSSDFTAEREQAESTMSTLCEQSADMMSTVSEQAADILSRKGAKGKESKGKESKGKESKEYEARFPESLDTPEHRAAFAEWLAYKRQRRETLLPVSQDKQLQSWASKPDRFIGAIQLSIAQGWAGIFEGRQSQKNATAANVGVSAREQRSFAVVSLFDEQEKAIEVEVQR